MDAFELAWSLLKARQMTLPDYYTGFPGSSVQTTDPHYLEWRGWREP